MLAILLHLTLFTCFLDSNDSGPAIPFFPSFQDQSRAVIEGRVTDNEGVPLGFATVFIANSTLGCITDTSGLFRLESVPYGQHVLVISFVGYETFKKDLVISTERIEQNARLKPSPIELTGVEVVERKGKNKWQSNFRKFETYFLGTTANASDCEILNPEVLRFHYDQSTRTLRAFANAILLIENRALGYRIHYVLELFELRNDGTSSYLGKEQFEPIEPNSRSEKEKWDRFRKEAYFGSFRHFLSSLADNTLDREGFLLTGSNSMIPYASLQQALPTSEANISIGQKYMISAGSRDYERLLRFRTTYLHIRYMNESEIRQGMGYQKSIDRIQPYQESWIRLLSLGAVFHTDGYLYNPLTVMVYGYWSKEKIADALPLDYFPEN